MLSPGLTYYQTSESLTEYAKIFVDFQIFFFNFSKIGDKTILEQFFTLTTILIGKRSLFEGE